MVRNLEIFILLLDSNSITVSLDYVKDYFYILILLERVIRIELTLSAWKAEVITIIRYPHYSQGTQID